LFRIIGAALAAVAGGNETSVTIGGRLAPVLYADPGQIVGQVPYEANAGRQTPVVVTVNGASSNTATVAVVPAAPGLFPFNDSDEGVARGGTITAYLTGAGELDHSVPTGATTPQSPISRPVHEVTATLNGAPATVSFDALVPGFVSVLAVSLQAPDLPPGSYPLLITINGAASNAALIRVR
jgi:uncharacterized protein (TIGR03437 family)